MATIVQYWGDGSQDRIILESRGDSLTIQSDSNDTGVQRSKTITLETLTTPKIYAHIYLTQEPSSFGILNLNLADVWHGEGEYKVGVSTSSIETSVSVRLTDTILRKGKVSAGTLEYWQSLPTTRSEMLVYFGGNIVGSFMISDAELGNIRNGISVNKIVTTPLL